LVLTSGGYKRQRVPISEEREPFKTPRSPVKAPFTPQATQQNLVMQLKTVLCLLLAFLRQSTRGVLVAGAEISLYPNSADAVGLQKRENRFGTSAFRRKTSRGSTVCPIVRLTLGVFLGGGSWTIAPVEGHCKLASYGTCAFGG
jgi:hypothetical protein